MREIQIISLLCLTAVAALSDLHTGRIPNGLIAVGLGCGFALQAVQDGVLGVLLFAGGAGLPILLFGALYFCRMIGAGDIKLLCVVGGFAGPAGGFLCVIFSVFFGGLIAVGLMIYHRNFSRRMECLFRYMESGSTEKEWKPYIKQVEEEAKFCFSVPVLMAVVAFVMRYWL